MDFTLLRLPEGSGHDFVALADDARGDGTGKAAKVEIGAQDILHRKSHLGEVAIRSDVRRLEMIQKRRPLIPRHGAALLDDVVALERRERDELNVRNVEFGDKAGVIRLDPLEGFLREADEIHFVDRDDNVLNAQQRNDKRMPAGLSGNAMPGVDQNDRKLAGACARRHVARVLLVAGRVGDDEFALVG